MQFYVYIYQKTKQQKDISGFVCRHSAMLVALLFLFNGICGGSGREGSRCAWTLARLVRENASREIV